MSYSAGLLKVDTLNVPGASGALQAINATVTTLNATNVTADTFGYNNLDLSGNLNVNGTTTLKVVNTVGTMDVSGNLNVNGTTTLKGVNTVGTMDVSGNLLVRGSVITNYNPVYPAINPAADWEGVWSSIDVNYTGYYNGYIALVKQPNNTYTAYTNATTGASGNNDSQFFNQQFQLLATNIVPTFTLDSSLNVTANSITLPRGFANAGSYPTTSVLVSRRLTNADIGSNFAFSIATSTNNQATAYAFIERIMVPSQVTPVKGGDWFSAYQSEYNETRINNVTHSDVFDDVEGTYNAMKKRLLNGYGIDKKATDIITGQVYPINKLSPEPFIVEGKFDKFKTTADVYALPVNHIHFGVYGKPNIMTFHYDWKVQNVPSPLISPFQEITIVNTNSPSAPVIGTIPSSFKFLRSSLEKQGCKQNSSGIKEPGEWFMDNFVGLRLPLVVSGNKTLTITTTGPTGNFDVIPGVYTVSIPDNWVGYPHSLAAYITQNLSVDSGLRLDFYTLNKDITNPETFTSSTTQNFFYLSSGNNSIASVSVTCNDSAFLTNVLGLNTLSTVQNPNAPPVTLVVGQQGIAGMFGNLQRGGFPKYTYNGNNLDVNNLYTPQTLPVSITNLTVNFSIGNVLTSGNPRDYFNAMFYFINLSAIEEHAISRNMLVLADINEEMYMPDTWEEAIFKFVDGNAFAIYTTTLIEYSILNSQSFGILGGKSLQNHSWNASRTTAPFSGFANAKNVLLTQGFATLEKVFKPSYASTLNDTQVGYVATNYLDSSNTFVIARRFTSTVTNLMSQNMGTYWMPLFLSGSGLPADVTVGAAAAVPYSVLLNDSSNSMYGVPWSFGNFIGIFKQSVANAILPPDASGSVCGYVFLGSCFYESNTPLRNAIVNLFKSKGVKYAVTDVRGNPGGAASSSLNPYGLNPNFTYFSMNNILGSHDWSSPSQSMNVIMYSTLVADILDNPTYYPAAWRYPVDASGYTITTLGGVDNTTYKQTGNKFTLYRKTTQTSVGNNTVDGSNNGQGLFSWCYLTDQTCFSAPKAMLNSLKGNIDTNDYNQYAGPTPPFTNTHYTLYGTYNRLFYEISNGLTNNYEYNVTVNPGNDGLLDQDVFYDNGYAILDGMRFDNSGNAFSNSFNQPGITFDAVSNWSPLTLMTESGVYYDASGIQQAYTDGSRNAYYVSNDNLNSYRDFRLERSLQCAYAQRATVRASPKFGYMPIDNGNTVSIVDASGVSQVYDPYNWNITDTSGALPLPANPFGL